MATYTSNYGWTKPSGSDNVDISVLNDNLDDQDSTIHDAFLNMAPPFSESSTYAVDDIVLYDTGLYKCHTAVVTPGSWTGSTNWQVYKLSEGGSGGGTSNYNDLSNKPSINGVTLSGNKTTSDLGINADNVMMSDGVTSVEDAIDNVYTATNGTGVSGTFHYTKIGRIVIGAGEMNITQDIAAYSAIVMGLPTPETITMGVFCTQDNGYNVLYVNKIANTGLITTRSARNNGEQLRLSCFYLAQS